jgi:hypothetical protein
MADTGLTRRAMLRGAGALSLAGLAGCGLKLEDIVALWAVRPLSKTQDEARLYFFNRRGAGSVLARQSFAVSGKITALALGPGAKQLALGVTRRSPATRSVIQIRDAIGQVQKTYDDAFWKDWMRAQGFTDPDEPTYIALDLAWSARNILTLFLSPEERRNLWEENALDRRFNLNLETDRIIGDIALGEHFSTRLPRHLSARIMDEIDIARGRVRLNGQPVAGIDGGVTGVTAVTLAAMP